MANRCMCALQIRLDNSLLELRIHYFRYISNFPLCMSRRHETFGPSLRGAERSRVSSTFIPERFHLTS
jgi:hypothetical protein